MEINQNNATSKINIFLTILISSLPIVGIGFIDTHIWDVIFVVLGMIAYSFVGLLYSLGIISTKREGSEANKYTFLFLLFCAYLFYELLWKIKKWLGDLPLYIKIISLIFIVCLIVFGFIFKNRKMLKNKK